MDSKEFETGNKRLGNDEHETIREKRFLRSTNAVNQDEKEIVFATQFESDNMYHNQFPFEDLAGVISTNGVHAKELVSNFGGYNIMDYLGLDELDLLISNGMSIETSTQPSSSPNLINTSQPSSQPKLITSSSPTRLQTSPPSEFASLLLR